MNRDFKVKIESEADFFADRYILQGCGFTEGDFCCGDLIFAVGCCGVVHQKCTIKNKGYLQKLVDALLNWLPNEDGSGHWEERLAF